MRLYEFVLPLLDNNKGNLRPEHALFRTSMLEVAGGYTQAFNAQGAWRDPKSGRDFYDEVVPYRVATDENGYRLLLNKAFTIFHDQAAIFVAEIGAATVHERVTQAGALSAGFQGQDGREHA